MPYLNKISEDGLRAMAREASSMFLRGEATPTGSVIKVASASSEALTTEHVQRICEMTYHEIFERSFRDSPGPDRLVSFDPPDAAKVASAVRATQMQSFRDKVASAKGGGAGMDKVADASMATAPRPQNAFLRLVSRAPDTTAMMKKEAQFTVRQTRDQLREAERQLQAELAGASGSEKVAFIELADGILQAIRNGVSAVPAVEACIEFAKCASESDAVLSSIATDLLRTLSRHGVRFDEKVASADMVLVPNERHPLRVQAIKVAELRGFRVRGELALGDIREQTARVERELQDALYQ